MPISKTSKVWAASVGAGLIAVGGGLMLIPVVGQGVGAIIITTGLATIGGLVGGGMLAGIGVIGAGGATAAAIAAAIANKVIRDPELVELAERLKKANELYDIARRVTEQQNTELEELNKRIGDMLASGKKDQERFESLKARLIVLILQLQLDGIGKTAAGSDTAAALDAVIANGLVPDPDLRYLAERLKVANELYGTRRATDQQKSEITDLNERVGDILRSQSKDKEQLESLNARLVVLIEQLKKVPKA